jgi:hypothetical protein
MQLVLKILETLAETLMGIFNDICHNYTQGLLKTDPLRKALLFTVLSKLLACIGDNSCDSDRDDSRDGESHVLVMAMIVYPPPRWITRFIQGYNRCTYGTEQGHAKVPP